MLVSELIEATGSKYHLILLVNGKHGGFYVSFEGFEGSCSVLESCSCQGRGKAE